MTRDYDSGDTKDEGRNEDHDEGREGVCLLSSVYK